MKNYKDSEIYSLNSMTIDSSTPFYEVKKDLGRKGAQVFLYRLIFLGFGTFFLILAAMISKQSISFNYISLFGESYILKHLFTGISSLFALGSLWLGCSLRTSHELVRSYEKQALKKMGKKFGKDPIIQSISFQAIEKLIELEHNNSIPEHAKFDIRLDILIQLKNRL